MSGAPDGTQVWTFREKVKEVLVQLGAIAAWADAGELGDIMAAADGASCAAARLGVLLAEEDRRRWWEAAMDSATVEVPPAPDTEPHPEPPPPRPTENERLCYGPGYGWDEEVCS